MAGPSFFRFNKWDWAIVIAAIPLIGGAFLWLNSLLIENKLNSVRIDFGWKKTLAIRLMI